MWFDNKGVCVGMGRVRKVKGQRGAGQFIKVNYMMMEG